MFLSTKIGLSVVGVTIAFSIFYSSAQAELAATRFDYNASVDGFDIAVADTKQNSRDNSDSLNFKERVTTASGKDDGGTRDAKGSTNGDTCPPTDVMVKALVPGDNSNSKTILTAQSYPTFWFYIPYSSKLTVEFIVQDDKNNYVEKEEYKLPGEPGIINISLSKQAKPLETGKKYFWSLKIKCNPKKSGADRYVNGFIKRVKSNPNLTPTATTKPEQKAKLYAEDGLWLDSLTTVIQEMSSANPKQSTYINDLFQVYGLQNFAGKKIIPCCSQQK